MKKGKKKPIETYLETRLWNAKGIETKKLLKEIERFYFNKQGKEMPLEAKKLFVRKIQVIRNRVAWKRWNLKKRKQKWAEMLGVPVEVVDELVERRFVKSAWDVRRLIPVVEMIKREDRESRGGQ